VVPLLIEGLPGVGSGGIRPVPSSTIAASRGRIARRRSAVWIWPTWILDKPGRDWSGSGHLQVQRPALARQSTGPGEYGVKTHRRGGTAAITDTTSARTREQAVELFSASPITRSGWARPASTIGAGKTTRTACSLGLVYPCDGVPKDLAYVHRNQSLLFRHFAPVYQEPTVYVLTPDSHRLGGGKWAVTEGILTSIDLALAAHVDNLGVAE